MYNSKENVMETNSQKEAQAILAMGEKIISYEAEIARLTKRVTELETVIANQRAMINELQ
jgi:SMC interacting uncharacterized protein involved in chromosome segregation